jgi:phage terminase small subunit
MLTIKQRRFVNLFAASDPDCRNNTEIAIKAGYSPDTAASIACENLKKPNILEAIEKREAEIRTAAEVSREYVIQALRQLVDVAFAAGDLAAMNSALDKLGKITGAYLEDNAQKTNRVDKLQVEIVDPKE